ncbi:TerD family protein [Mycolicibacterium peregrinum]|uniref:TerD family protein n=1 Tax=Mycolicibacterium peregrinum TaxID=43304 RepID=UPI001F188E13|nr:TerD family protein [Mycolicibacterium peregrinum]
MTANNAAAVDLLAVALDASGQVRSDSDFVFFNNPSAAGITLLDGHTAQIDLQAVPADVERLVVAASTEAQGLQFADVTALAVNVDSPADTIRFIPPALSTETVVQLVALYRRSGRWRLDAIGQGYADGLASFARNFGITVDDDEPSAAAVPTAPQPTPSTPAAKPINMTKVAVVLTKDSPTKTATIDLRKSKGDPNWVLTVGLEWDGRDAIYDSTGRVTRWGTGDLDVYFFCRNEVTNEYVVISGDFGRQGSLQSWPYVQHYGDSQDPGIGNKPAVEQVRVLPQENGDLLVNIYQSVDNGSGAINTFGRPRCAIRYGRAGADGLPGPDADEILVYVGNSKDSYWATVAHIDVQDGILTVDGDTRYSAPTSEQMPGLDTAGKWVREPNGGPIGQSKSENRGQGLTRYSGQCQPSKR